MASAEGISVAVESAVHDALRELAQSVWAQHGIRIESVAFDWIDLSTPVEERMIVVKVQATTSTRRGRT